MSKLSHDPGGSLPSTTAAPAVGFLSDAALVEQLRIGTAEAAQAAADELRRRHLPSAQRYSELFTHGTSCATELAAEAFAMACRGLRRGTDLNRPVGLRLLRNVQLAAAAWSSGPQRYRLVPDFLAWADTPGPTPSGPTPARPALREAYERLGGSLRGALWYEVVEQQPPPVVARLLGDASDSASGLAVRALAELRMCLLSDTAGYSDDNCRGFTRIMAIVSLPDEKRSSPEFDLHLMYCAGCAGKLDSLRTLFHAPRTALLEALLPWAPTAYAARIDSAHSVGCEGAGATMESAVAPAAVPTAAAPGSRRRSGSRASVSRPVRLMPVLCIAGVTFVGLAFAARLGLTGSTAPDAHHSAGRTVMAVTSPGGPASQGTGTVPLSPSANSSPTVPAGEPSIGTTPPGTPAALGAPHAPSRPTGSSPTIFPRPQTAPPAAIGLAGGAYVRVLNAASGLCLDSASSQLADNVLVVMSTCVGSATQEWLLDGQGLIHNYADPGYCLDMRGQTDKHLDLWTCGSASSGTMNLSFRTDDNGRIRPLMASGYAVTPCGGAQGSLLGLQAIPSSGDAPDERWN